MKKFSECPGCGRSGLGGMDVFRCSACDRVYCSACSTAHMKTGCSSSNPRKILGKY